MASNEIRKVQQESAPRIPEVAPERATFRELLVNDESKENPPKTVIAGENSDKSAIEDTPSQVRPEVMTTAFDPAPEEKAENEAACKDSKDVFIPSLNYTATQDAITHDQRPSTVASHAVFPQTGNLWKDKKQTITYAWASGKHTGTPIQHSKVVEAIKEWEHYGEVEFMEHDSTVQSQPHVVISFGPSLSEGSGSAAERDQGSEIINLGWVDEHNTNLTTSDRATIFHEFGHALGMLHEQRSPAGGGTGLKNADAAIKYYSESQGWSDNDVRAQIMKTYDLSDVSSFSKSTD